MDSEKVLMMCTSRNCPLRDSCYRALGKINLLVEQKYSNLEDACIEKDFSFYIKFLDLKF